MPVMEVEGEFGFEIVAVPDIIVQTPDPDVGLLAVMLADVAHIV